MNKNNINECDTTSTRDRTCKGTYIHVWTRKLEARGPRARSPGGRLTLQPLRPVALDHDAELQHQLRRALQEGLQQAQHVDVGVLEHHGPVEAPLVLLLPVALYAEVHGADVPGTGWAQTQDGDRWLETP